MNIRGQRMDLWRAGDSEGEVLDMLVPAKRDTAAALKLMKKLLKKQQMVPDEIATDGLPRRSISTVCCRSLPSVRSVIRSRLKVKPVRSLPKHAGWRLAGHRLDALCRSDCASPRLRPRDGRCARGAALGSVRRAATPLCWRQGQRDRFARTMRQKTRTVRVRQTCR